MHLKFAISSRKISLILGSLSVYFAVQSLIAEYLIENVLDNNIYRSLVLTIDLFSVNAEQTIPTWYSTLLLFAAAALLILIARAKYAAGDRYWRHWGGLAVILLYLSMDEGAAIHEIVADGLQNTLNLTGFLTFGWQIVAVPLVIVFIILYARFVFHLPRRTRNLLILAGALYMGGALVVEGISANQYDLQGGVTFNYLAIATIEELCEMLGAVLLIYTLLDYGVEMQYAFVFQPQPVLQPIHNSASDKGSAASFQPESVHTARDTFQDLFPFFNKRLLYGAALLISGLNIVLVSWAFTTPPPPKAPAENPVTSAEAIFGQAVAHDILLTRLSGRFSGENLAARQVVHALLDIYDEVIVVTVNSSNSSIALAADELPLDRDQLSDVLLENGETQYIIFETQAVKAIVGKLTDNE